MNKVLALALLVLVATQVSAFTMPQLCNSQTRTVDETQTLRINGVDVTLQLVTAPGYGANQARRAVVSLSDGLQFRRVHLQEGEAVQIGLKSVRLTMLTAPGYPTGLSRGAFRVSNWFC